MCSVPFVRGEGVPLSCYDSMTIRHGEDPESHGSAIRVRYDEELA